MRVFQWLSVLCLCISLTACSSPDTNALPIEFDEYTIEAYDGKHAYAILNGNEPVLDKQTLDLKVGEEVYSDLDRLDRCGRASAYLGVETMPQEKRESIGMVRPSGWQISKYDCVDGKYLYNRCHLIGFQLSGENANDKNLITGTRYMNVDGMLPFENEVAEYIRSSHHHVLYEVTPIFVGDELVARGVQMQAQSVEDDAISFHVFVYNVQPFVKIDYRNGDNHSVEQLDSIPFEEALFVVDEKTKEFHNPGCKEVQDIYKEYRRDTDESQEQLQEEGYEPASCMDQDRVEEYVLNTNSKKFHRKGCKNAQKISEKNKKIKWATYHELIDLGYEVSQCCF